MEQTRFTQELGGKVERYEIIAPYRRHLLQDVPKLKRPLKVVVDAGSGTGGPVAPPIFRQLGCTVWEIACTPDGNFPIHHPDPTMPKNLELLVNKVRAERADLDIAYDAMRIASARREGQGLLSQTLQYHRCRWCPRAISARWGLIRASNTQPALVLRFEAQTVEKMKKYRAIVEAKLKELES